MKLSELLIEFSGAPENPGGGGQVGVYIWIQEGLIAYVVDAHNIQEIIHAIMHAAKMMLAKHSKRGGKLAGWSEQKLEKQILVLIQGYNESDDIYGEVSEQEVREIEDGEDIPIETFKLHKLAQKEAAGLIQAIIDGISHDNVYKKQQTMASKIYHGDKTTFSSRDLEQIKNDPHAARYYAGKIIGGPWPPGEPAILNGPSAGAVWYAASIRKNRWPELEQKIIKELNTVDESKMRADDIPTPDGGGEHRFESLIQSAALYASTFLNQTWPAAEAAIRRFSDKAQTQYKDNLARARAGS